MANTLEKFFLNKVKSMPPVEVELNPEKKSANVQKAKQIPKGKKVKKYNSNGGSFV